MTPKDLAQFASITNISADRCRQAAREMRHTGQFARSFLLPDCLSGDTLNAMIPVQEFGSWMGLEAPENVVSYKCQTEGEIPVIHRPDNHSVMGRDEPG